MEWWVTAGGVLTVLISIIASIVAGRRGADREWERVAHARGEEIKDLRIEVAELKAEVLKFQSQMETLQRVKATEIANEVVTSLVPILRQWGGLPLPNPVTP